MYLFTKASSSAVTALYTSVLAPASTAGCDLPSPDSESAAPEEEQAAASEEAAEPGPAAAVDRASMSVDDMIAWCREHDAS